MAANTCKYGNSASFSKLADLQNWIAYNSLWKSNGFRTSRTLYARTKQGIQGKNSRFSLKFARSNAPVRTLAPLAIWGPICYTLVMGYKAHPLGSTAVTSGMRLSSPLPLLTPQKCLFYAVFGELERLNCCWSIAILGVPGHEKRRPSITGTFFLKIIAKFPS